ncbi:hypothetical protein ACFIQG_20600 [Comamonas odontotermitis]|uniref:hypothetical protein n=1 Tax=Comamonas odontotermitis TaxID=379895 RepID=UPI00366D87A2
MAEPTPSSAPLKTAGEPFVALGECMADQICQRVAELPDRDSPADWPEAMLVTSDELRNIVLDAINDASQAVAVPDDVASALDRMDSLLKPGLGLLAVGDDSATAAASRRDMATIRAAHAATPALPATKAAPAAVVYAEARECSHCNHVGINDSADGVAACTRCGWHGDSPKEDKCPECEAEGSMTASCPKCHYEYSFLADASIATPALPATEDSSAGGLVAVQSDANDPIKEVMELVRAAMDSAMWAGELVLETNGNFEAQFESAKRLKCSIETKLRALLPGSAPQATQAQPADALDAARFRWLVEDHAKLMERIARNALCERLAVMSYSAACADIDAAMAAAKKRENHS